MPGLTTPGRAAEVIRVGGTGGIVPLMAVIRDRVAASQPGFEIDVLPSLGSAGGIRGVATGAIELGLSGRPLTDVEAAQGLSQRLFLTTPFVLVTSTEKPPPLQAKDVAAYLNGERPRWPDGTPVRPIQRPRSDQDVLLLSQFFPGAEAALVALRRRIDVPTAANDQDNLTLARQIPGSLTAATLVQVRTEHPSLGVLSIDGATPSLDSLLEGDYPYSKIIYLVTRPPHGAALVQLLSYLYSPEVEKLLAESGAYMLHQ